MAMQDILQSYSRSRQLPIPLASQLAGLARRPLLTPTVDDAPLTYVRCCRYHCWQAEIYKSNADGPTFLFAVAKRVAGWAANHYLVTAEKPEVRNNKLVIQSAR